MAVRSPLLCGFPAGGMRCFLSLLLVVTSNPFLMNAQPQQHVIQRTHIAITHVAIIDINSGSIEQDMTAIVAGNHITAVGKASNVNVPQSAQVIDGRESSLFRGCGTCMCISSVVDDFP
jgi:hypothetical protein